MSHTRRGLVLELVLATGMAASATAQQFALRARGAAPALPVLLGKDEGVAIDIDRANGVDILQKGGSAWMADGNLGFVWAPPGTRIPSLGGIPNFFDFAKDIDGDGQPELVFLSVSLALSSELYVNPSRPGGFFGPRAVVGTTSGWTQSLRLEDLDGDGYPDLLFHRVYPQQENGLMRNRGDGTFFDVSATCMPAIPMDAAVALADVAGDSLPDLVVRTNGTLQLLLNLNGVFVVVPSGLPSVSALQGLALADADADGDQDLLIATGAGVPMQLWLGDGNGHFTASTVVLPPAGTGQAFVDLDGDHRADLVAIESAPLGQQVCVYHNLLGAQFQRTSSAPIDSLLDLGSPLLTDLDGDADLDVIVGGSLCYLNDGHFGFQALQLQPIAETAIDNTIVAGDLDGDDFVDLVIGDSLHHNRGDGWFTNLGAVLPTEARARALADLDNDGDLDIVWNRATSTVVDSGILVNQGGQFIAGPVFAGIQLRGRVCCDDFDNDGLVDLVSEGNSVFRNLGGFAFAVVATLAIPDRPLATGDFDGDGLSDIVATQANAWFLWRNLGNNSFQRAQSVPVGLQGAAVGDFDGDGNLDVAGTFLTSTTGNNCFLRVWSLQSTGWVGGTIYQDGGDSLGSIAAGDFDRDGDLDLVGQKLWTNTGGAQLVDANSGVQFSGALAVADIDGDRDLDILRASNTVSNFPRRPFVFTNRLIDIHAAQMPVMGHTYTVTVGSRVGQGISGDPVLLALALARTTGIAIPPFGLLLLDPLSILAMPVGVTDSRGLCDFSLMLPRIPALAGMDAFWQGAVANASGVRFTGLWIDRLLQ